jgi:hypothetical protein
VGERAALNRSKTGNYSKSVLRGTDNVLNEALDAGMSGVLRPDGCWTLKAVMV